MGMLDLAFDDANAPRGEMELAPEHYAIAIIGSGPAGLSAAARAAEVDRDAGGAPTHVLLEAGSLHADTIQKYQKGKHVMDEPGYLELRSPLEFAAGSREAILDNWEQGVRDAGINLRCGAEVTAISGPRGAFTIGCANGQTCIADTVVLAIGTQGNPRRLGVAGDQSDFVQYQLDDPDAYQDEDIVVVGAGDAAIENALGLARGNRVVIVNRKNEFLRAKQRNLDAVLVAINDPGVAFSCRYDSGVKALKLPVAAGAPGSITLATPSGEEEIPCHRVIARLGSIPPRAFLEQCGIALPSDEPTALPELDGHYQCNVPGLYVIGALAGYPLIKQAMNQGHDVIEFIHGNQIKPVEHPLLALKFALLPYLAEVDELLALYQRRVPMFARMNALAYRELILESDIVFAVGDAAELRDARQRARRLCNERIGEIRAASAEEDLRRAQAGRAPKPPRPADEPVVTRVVAAGDYVLREGDYTDSFFTIVEGGVTLYDQHGTEARLRAGQFFGELSLLSGRPRVGSARVAAATILIETPRRAMVKLMATNPEVAKGIKEVYLQRSLRVSFAPTGSYTKLGDIARKVSTAQYHAGETIYREGDPGDCLFLISSGTVGLTSRRSGKRIAVGQFQSGQVFGQLALMGDPVRRETAVASVRTQVISIKHPEFLALLHLSPATVPVLQMETARQLRNTSRMEALPEGGEIISFLLGKGVGEATNVLVIDESLCIGCDNCEIACAETHEGISRLDRKAGVRFADINLPIACRHCEQPHCMKDCPPNAIHRAASGEVFIDDSCIGCGNCQTNCPYGVIKMSYAAPKKPGLLQWLLAGRGPGPGEELGFEPTAAARQAGTKAVKCDACMERKSGPACVQACPTGAAYRLSPAEFVELAGREA